MQQVDGMRLWIDTTTLPINDDGRLVFGVLEMNTNISPSVSA